MAKKFQVNTGTILAVGAGVAVIWGLTGLKKLLNTFGFTESQQTKDVDKEEEIGKDFIEGLSLSSLIKMSIPSFRSEIKNYSPSQLKSLKKSLIDRKNLSLNELRTLRRSKSKDLDKAKSKEDKTLTLNKYNSRIYEVGEFID